MADPSAPRSREAGLDERADPAFRLRAIEEGCHGREPGLTHFAHALHRLQSVQSAWNVCEVGEFPSAILASGVSNQIFREQLSVSCERRESRVCRAEVEGVEALFPLRASTRSADPSA